MLHLYSTVRTVLCKNFGFVPLYPLNHPCPRASIRGLGSADKITRQSIGYFGGNFGSQKRRQTAMLKCFFHLVLKRNLG